jgi:hypothetical protein
MTRWRSTTTAVLLALGLAVAPPAVLAQSPKYGGVLTLMQREELLVPKPFGSWGLSDGELGQIPGRPDGRKAAARTLLAEAGYGPASPLRFEAQTRGIATDVDLAS